MGNGETKPTASAPKSSRTSSRVALLSDSSIHVPIGSKPKKVPVTSNIALDMHRTQHLVPEAKHQSRIHSVVPPNTPVTLDEFEEHLSLIRGRTSRYNLRPSNQPQGISMAITNPSVPAVRNLRIAKVPSRIATPLGIFVDQAPIASVSKPASVIGANNFSRAANTTEVGLRRRSNANGHGGGDVAASAKKRPGPSPAMPNANGTAKKAVPRYLASRPAAIDDQEIPPMPAKNWIWKTRESMKKVTTSSLIEDTSNECQICFERSVNCTIVACGHQRTCFECADKLYKLGQPCPWCRQPISTVVLIFK